MDLYLRPKNGDAHPSVIKLKSLVDRKSIYLIFELCLSGELYDRIMDAIALPEVQAAISMQQVVRVIYYTHGQHVCHEPMLKKTMFRLSSLQVRQVNALKTPGGLSTGQLGAATTLVKAFAAVVSSAQGQNAVNEALVFALE